MEAGAASTEERLDALLARAAALAPTVDPAILEPVTAPPPVDEGPTGPVPRSRDELRRLTIMFSDLVGSTSLSARLDPETYRTVLGAYKDTCRRVIEQDFDGHLVHTRGDGMLAVFGYPTAHEDDAARAVLAGIAIQAALAETAARVQEQTGEPIAARIGVHRGLVYVERETEELYGLAVNVAARVQEAAAPGTVAVTDEVRSLVAEVVATSPLPAVEMKGVERAPALHAVLEERPRGPRSGRRWPSPIVGRDEALADLRARFAAAAGADRPQATLVVGDAGVGKSRLVGAFLDELPRSTVLVELAGSPRHREQGLHPVRELLWRWADVRGDRAPASQLAALRDHLAARDLDRFVPLLAPVAGIPPEAGYTPAEVDPGRLQELIADAVHELLASPFGSGGVLLVEDLHWLDTATRDAVARLVRTGPPGVFVLVTSREPLSLGVAAPALDLEPLPPERCVELARHHHPDVPDEVTADLVARSDGIPLFVEELVRAHAAGTDALTTPGATGAGRDGAVEVPPALYDALSSRLSALDDARLVASAAATIGRTVHLDLLARVTDLPADELDGAITGLMDAHVLEPHHGDGRTVRFRHELVRLVAYELEPPSGRQQLHAAAARALAAGDVADGADWAVIADHHRRSGAPRAAAAALEQAADDARQRGSMEEARGHFDRALTWLADAPADLERDRFEVRLRLARAYLAVSAEGFGSEHAAHDYVRSLELSIDRPESAELYRALIATWGLWINKADLDRAWATSTALRPLSLGVRSHMLPTNEAGFGMIELYRARYHEGVRRLGDAVARIPEVGAAAGTVPDDWSMAGDPLATMHALHSLALTWTGDLAAATHQHDAARSRCASLPFPMGPFSDVFVLLVRSMGLAHLGDAAASAAAVEAAHAIAEERGFEAWAFWASTLRMTAAARLVPDDQVAGMLAPAAMAADMMHALDVKLFSSMMRASMAAIALEAGDLATADTMAQAALALADETGALMAVTEALRIRAMAGPAQAREDGLLAAWARADEEGAVINGVRISTDLVRTCGPAHRPRLEAALDRVVSDDGAPVLADARALLAVR